MRGRLIFKFLAELHRLASASEAQSPTQGYDPDFKESVLFDADDDGIGERSRLELPAVLVPCQVSTKTFEELYMLASGDSPRSAVELLFHFKDLERLGLVDSSKGETLIRPGDRLSALRDLCGGLVQEVRTPPGLYVTEARPCGFGLGLNKPSRNLLAVTFEGRRLGTRRHS